MLLIISGPSSVGKSHFLSNAPLKDIAGLSNNLPVLFPHSDLSIITNGFQGFLHYNILRPAHYIDYLDHTKNLLGIPKNITSLLPFSKEYYSWQNIKPQWKYQLDNKWNQIKYIKHKKAAIVLITSYDVLIDRISKRHYSEDKLKPYSKKRLYNKKYWRKLYNIIDIKDIYNIWLQELRKNRIPYKIIYDYNNKYLTLNDSKKLDTILKGRHPI